MVWSAAERDGFVDDVQAMRRRVLDHIPAHEAERQLKLGSGGLRDVEFAVQLLQLVHGRADPSLRERRDAERAGPPDRGRLRRPRGRREARTRPTRSCAPSSTGSSCTSCGVRTCCPRTRRRCAGSAGRSGIFSEPAAQLDKQWRYHRREVRRLHEKLFYRPLLGAVAKLPGAEARLSLEAAEARLAALGLRRPEGRAAPPRGADQRGLAHLRHPAHPAAGAARVVRRLARPGRRAVRLPPDQREPGPHARGTSRCCATRARSPSGWPHVLGTSRYATDLLEREPQGVKMLGESLEPLSAEAALGRDAVAARAGRDARGRGRGGAGRTPPRAAADRVRRPRRPAPTWRWSGRA